MNTEKQILRSILEAHCLTSENTRKVIKLAGINARVFNGKRSHYQVVDLLVRAIPSGKVKEIINHMPFPFIEHWSRNEDDHQYWLKKLFHARSEVDTFGFYSNNVLCPLPMIKGYKMENKQGYATVIVKQ